MDIYLVKGVVLVLTLAVVVLGSIAACTYGGIKYARSPAAVKRVWRPRLVGMAAIAFLLFVLASAAGSGAIRHAANIGATTVVVGSALAYLTIRHKGVCPKCYTGLYNHYMWQPINFCPQCGASLKAVKLQPDDDLLA